MRVLEDKVEPNALLQQSRQLVAAEATLLADADGDRGCLKIAYSSVTRFREAAIGLDTHLKD